MIQACQVLAAERWIGRPFFFALHARLLPGREGDINLAAISYA